MARIARPWVSPLLPAWWRGFGPIKVPWTADQGGGFPDLRPSASRGGGGAGISGSSPVADPFGWVWPTITPDDEDIIVPVPTLPPVEDEDEGGGAGGGGEEDEEGGEGAPPAEVPTGPPAEGVGSGGYIDPADLPRLPDIPHPVDQSPGWGEILPVPIPGSSSGFLPGGYSLGIPPYMGIQEALGSEEPYYRFAGATSLVPGVGPALSLGLNVLGKVAGIGRVTSGDRRDVGQQIWDMTTPVFFEHVLGRPQAEIYGSAGTSAEDLDFLLGFQNARLDPMDASWENRLGINYNSVLADYGQPKNLLTAMYDYYMSLPPAERPALGNIEGWSDAGISAQQQARQWDLDRDLVAFGPVGDYLSRAQYEDLGRGQFRDRRTGEILMPWNAYNPFLSGLQPLTVSEGEYYSVPG